MSAAVGPCNAVTVKHEDQAPSLRHVLNELSLVFVSPLAQKINVQKPPPVSNLPPWLCLFDRADIKVQKPPPAP